jgi:multidrug efflux pump subunit AcrB
MMTSLAMMAGMVPMAMSGGQAAPLGRAVLGGFAFGTLATLLILPAAFAFFSSKTARSAALDTDLD